MDFESFVLAASTADLADEPAARDAADAVEFRMDLAADNPVAAVTDYDGDLPLIATNRADWEGGEAADGPDRLAALETAAQQPTVGAIDVELATVERDEADALLAVARETDTSVVVSVHDFEATPPKEKLRDLLERAGEAGDVAKLAVTAASPDDVLTLLEATRAASVAGETVATMAMGEAGRHSRAVAPLYGSRIGYAPVDPGEATAPGQFDLATLRRLVDRLQHG
ncbi:type I 3-dehydroquinate dehydratase [Halobacteriales archaeon Cl-PHB]